MLAEFLQQDYSVLSTICPQEVAQTLSQSSKIELALIDTSGLNSSIWMACQQIREQEIPFLVTSPRHYAVIQQASMAHEDLGLLEKPLAMREFLHLIRELLKGSE